MDSVKYYNIEIRGRVQDIGFRNLVENIARSLNLRGMVYNDLDGTVKIICGGIQSAVVELIEEIREKSINVGATVEGVDKEEIEGRIFLPPVFFKAPTDELGDISRKLDVGVGFLHSIDTKLDRLDSLDTKLDRLDSLDTKLDRLDSLDTKLDRLDSLDTKVDVVVELLRKIAEK